MPRDKSIHSSEDESSDGADSNYKNLPMRCSKRTQKVPSRYGSIDTPDLLSSEADDIDFYDSEEDTEYVPLTKKQKSELLNSHEESIDNPSTSKDTSTGHALSFQSNLLGSAIDIFTLTSVDLDNMDFNSKFNELTDTITKDHGKKTSLNSSTAQTVPESTSNAIDGSTSTDGNSSQVPSDANSEHQKDGNVQMHLPMSDKSNQISNCKCDFNTLEATLVGMNRKLIEILARQSVLEKALLKKGVLDQAVGNEKPESPIAKLNDPKIYTFMKSNNLPMINLVDMKAFEEKLGDEVFFSSVVRIIYIFKI